VSPYLFSEYAIERAFIITAIILDDKDLFDTLFTQKAYQSIDEVIQQESTAKRQRASRK
jgi:hypothetical protein